MKRIVFEITYCDQGYLDSINSVNTCKSKEETHEFFHHFEINGHQNKEFIDLYNLHNVDSVFKNTEKLLKKDNEFLFINTFDDFLNRWDKEYWNYIRITNNEIELADDVFGFRYSHEKFSFLDAQISSKES